jgi:hypothetical protein
LDSGGRASIDLSENDISTKVGNVSNVISLLLLCGCRCDLSKNGMAEIMEAFRRKLPFRYDRSSTNVLYYTVLYSTKDSKEVTNMFIAHIAAL